MLYGLWLLLAFSLYFFENNGGTRIVLAASVLLPLIPAVRRSLFSSDEPASEKPVSDQTAFDPAAASPRTEDGNVRSLLSREEDEPGEIRAYRPGDPVNRIHWKLSAKRNMLLVRETERGAAEEAAQKNIRQTEMLSAPRRQKKRIFLIGLFIILAALILLWGIPEARRGAQALLNRVFDRSEAVNAYVYERFPVPETQPVVLSALLLALIPAALLGMAVFSGSRLPVFLLMTGCVLFQVYFGVAFPGWINVLLFALFALWMLRRPRSRAAVCLTAGVIAVLSAAVLLFWPGVDAATETVSEQVRDNLSRMAQSVAGTAAELPAGEHETRHVHTQSLTAGEQEARTGKEYRLVDVEEEQISMPRWVNYLKIALLLLLSAAVVILPFLPFLLVNARRKKAMKAREAFQSENVSEAVCAVFQQVIAWLEATGHGKGNIPYRAWSGQLEEGLWPERYAERFGHCAALFEEAAYSNHPLREEERRQALDLLAETEKVLQGSAGWKQKLRLRYRECLWV